MVLFISTTKVWVSSKVTKFRNSGSETLRRQWTERVSRCWASPCRMVFLVRIPPLLMVNPASRSRDKWSHLAENNKLLTTYVARFSIRMSCLCFRCRFRLSPELLFRHGAPELYLSKRERWPEGQIVRPSALGQWDTCSILLSIFLHATLGLSKNRETLQNWLRCPFGPSSNNRERPAQSADHDPSARPLHGQPCLLDEVEPKENRSMQLLA